MFAFLEPALRFGAACEAAEVEYFLGGSAATTFHGEPRMTNDLDFVVNARPEVLSTLTETLGPDFECDLEALTRACRLRSSWNVFYLPNFTKIDVFFLKLGDYDQEEFSRRQPQAVTGSVQRLWVKTPEDSIPPQAVLVPRWRGVSERQWRDVVMTLRANSGRLDEAYLDRWSARLTIAELLIEARAAAT